MSSTLTFPDTIKTWGKQSVLNCENYNRGTLPRQLVIWAADMGSSLLLGRRGRAFKIGKWMAMHDAGHKNSYAKKAKTQSANSRSRRPAVSFFPVLPDDESAINFRNLVVLINVPTLTNYKLLV
jgi:hypothetical protein